MSYEETMAKDIERAKAIIKKGKLTEDDFKGSFATPEIKQSIIEQSGTIYGSDVYVVSRLLESLVEELEKFYGLFSTEEDRCESFEVAQMLWEALIQRHVEQVAEYRRRTQSQYQHLQMICEMADEATGIDRQKDEADVRPSGAIGAVRVLVQRFKELQARLLVKENIKTADTVRQAIEKEKKS